MRKPCTNTAKACCQTTSQILKHLILLILRSTNISTYWYCKVNVRKSYTDKAITCCRTTSHILKHLGLLTLQGKNISTYWYCEVLNIRKSYINTAKHAAEHLTYSNILSYWQCEVNWRLNLFILWGKCEEIMQTQQKHAAKQHLTYSNISSYWHCEVTIRRKTWQNVLPNHISGKPCCPTLLTETTLLVDNQTNRNLSKHLKL
jgi:hypothetical protein